MFQKIAIAVCIVFAGYTEGLAHPVSFKDGIGVMPSYMSYRRDLELNYSITNRHALGVNAIAIDYKDRQATFVLPQFNYRLYRENEMDSQMNLYLSAGAGTASYESSDSMGTVGAFQFDYETRRIYTLFLAETLHSTSGLNLNRFRYRLGFTPYLADFDDVSTWFIAQIEFTPELDNEITVTPLVRFFLDNYLFEIGSSTRGDLFVAGIFHF